MAVISGNSADMHEKLYNQLGVSDNQYNWPENGLLDLKDYSDQLSDLADGDIQLNLLNGNMIFPDAGLNVSEVIMSHAVRAKRVLKDIYDKSQREAASVEVYTSVRIIE